MTHELMKNTLERVGHGVERAEITRLEGSLLYTELVLDVGSRLNARLSDCVALAVLMGFPIYAEESVLDQIGLPAPDGVQDDAEVDQSRDFLNRISPEDFG